MKNTLAWFVMGVILFAVISATTGQPAPPDQTKNPPVTPDQVKPPVTPDQVDPPIKPDQVKDPKVTPDQNGGPPIAAPFSGGCLQRIAGRIRDRGGIFGLRK